MHYVPFGSQDIPVFCARGENDLFLVCGLLDLVFMLVEIDMVLHAGRKSLGFSLSIDVDLFFLRVLEIELISVWRTELDMTLS